MQTLKVSIGICAYNEEANIRRLLVSLASQVTEGFEVVEVLVNSDGSTDQTVTEAKQSQISHLSIFDNADRKGKSFRQHELFQRFGGDVIVMLDADVVPVNDTFLTSILKPFLEQQNVGLVSCPLKPLPARTGVEEAINYSVALKDSFMATFPGFDTVYACHGPIRVFAKKLVSAYTDNTIVSEDAYSYLLCKKIGMRFVYVPDTHVWYRSPQTTREYYKQSSRYRHGQTELAKIFSAEVVKRAHAIPLSTQLWITAEYALRRPLVFTRYLCLLAGAKLFAFQQTGQVATWDMIASSKKL